MIFKEIAIKIRIKENGHLEIEIIKQLFKHIRIIDTVKFIY